MVLRIELVDLRRALNMPASTSGPSTVQVYLGATN